MVNSAINKAPVEIWERILLDVIHGISAPVFDVSCTSSNYLAFKRTCGDGGVVPRHEYNESERDRVAMRHVCRAWRIIADRWNHRERWIRIATADGQVSWERWKDAQRIEFTSHNEVGPYGDYGPKVLEEGGRLRVVLFDWKLSYVAGGSCMQVKRLEMLHLRENGFKRVIEALCNASQALTALQSLSLSIPIEDENPLRMISDHFPKLTHLTLRFVLYTGNQQSPSYSPDRAVKLLHFRKLEVLFLICTESCFHLSNWMLPALRHLHVRARSKLWESMIVPFIKHKALDVETFDLEDLDEPKRWGTTVSRNQSGLSAIQRLSRSSDNFWDTFSQLRLLRCKLGRGIFQTYPDVHHNLEHLVHSKPISSVDDMVEVLEPWLSNGHVKRLKTIVLFGPYLSSGACIRESYVDPLLHQLRSSGTRLINPAGRSWVDM